MSRPPRKGDRLNRKSEREPRYVLVDFDSEIEARDDFLPWAAHAKPKPAEPPLPFTKVPGLLEAWQKSATGWTGLVAYTFPIRGDTFGNMYGSFPATQLQPVTGHEWTVFHEQLRDAHRVMPGKR